MPVHVACRMQKLDMLKVLLNGFDGKIDQRNLFGETPLCIALNASCIDIVRFLVQRGLCDVTLCLRQRVPDIESKDDCALAEHDQCTDSEALLSQMPYYDEPTSSIVHAGQNQHQPSLNESAGDNALHFACKANDIKLLQLLLNHTSSSSVKVVNCFGDTPVHIAAKNGRVSMIECLLASCKLSLDSLINNDGNSVLHMACERGSLKIVKLLLDSCSLTLKNKDGNTPIHAACKNKSVELVSCLLEKCSGNLDNLRNKNNDTILHIAAEVGDLNVINLLLKHCSTTCQNSNGDTPIHIACTANCQSVVESLLENNKSTYPFANNSGQTYLHAACNKNAKLNIVKSIFNSGHKALGNCVDEYGDIPLHYACRYGQIDIIEYLMTGDRCDPYRFNKKDLSPIYCALWEKNFKLIEYVIRKRLCDLNQHIKNGSPLLHCLIEIDNDGQDYYRRTTYEQLVEYGEDLVAEDRSLVMYPPSYHYQNSLNILSRFLDILELLSNQVDVDFNATDCNGNTALHLACKLEQHRNVKLLLKTDAVTQSLSHRNHDDKSPIQLTRDYGIIRLLLSYGANPGDVYDRFASILERSKEKQPLEPAVKVIVLGNATAGKTTLVAVLQSNNKDVFQVEGSTAGIETTKYKSKKFGPVTFHDFAGQPEYESSHSAFLETCSSSMQPPLFLLVVDASQPQYIEKMINNWLSFIQNHCTPSADTPPHVIVIGSHIDQVQQVKLSHVKSTFVRAIENFKSSEFKCFEPVYLDCQKADTKGMKTLLRKLSKSCLTLKQFVELDCRCHILFANLLEWFPADNIVKVKDLLHRIKQSTESVGDYLPRRIRFDYWYNMHDPRYYGHSSKEILLPNHIQPLIDLLKSLHAGGHLLLLENDTLEDSWIVMNQDALFKTVNGILFAPKDFKYHLKLENNTGVVPLTKLQKLFPELDFDMVKQFLIHYEFCHIIEDHETLKLIHGSNELMDEMGLCAHTYYFFPGFVRSEKPMGIWDKLKESSFVYSFSCGWMLQCEPRQFFETRFLHVLLLRLTFTFVDCTSETALFKRKCNIWKNGIHWGTTDGAEVIVELIEEKTLLVVLVRCYEGQELEAVKLRSAVLKKIWEVKNEFSSKVDTNEYLIHPSFLINFSSLQDLTQCQISMREVSQEVVKGSRYVVCSWNNIPVPLDALLYYEPYSRMDEKHVSYFFSKENANNKISQEIFLELSNFLHPIHQHLIKVLKIPETEVGFHRENWRDHPVQLVHRLFDSWVCRKKKPTFQTLRSEFDEYSIFFGRDPQEICKSKPDPKDSDEDKADYTSDM